MTFSVIVPIYNGEKFLRESLDGLVGQLHEDEIEIFLMENGSKDGSPAICDEYASRYEAVKSFHLGPVGAYHARREGMKRAEGKWLIFVDADDELVDGAINKLTQKIATFPDYESAPDIILYDWACLENGTRSDISFPFENGKIYEGEEKEAFYDVMCRGDSLNALWNKCIKKSLAMKALINCDMGFMNHGEDLLQTAEFLDQANSITYFKQVLYLYKSNSEGLTGSFHSEFLPNQIAAWERFDVYANKWSRGNEGITALIDARKALTCTIAVKTLIYSDLKLGEKKQKLTELTESSFYREYALRELPEWASEEDVFVHDLQISDKSYKKLINSGIKHDIKSYIKARIRY